MFGNSLGDVNLDGDKIVISKTLRREKHLITPETRATVETAGDVQSRFSATRLVVFFPAGLALKKKKDKRELYLTVEGADWVHLEEVDPKKGKEARKFAAKINDAARHAQPPAVDPQPPVASPAEPDIPEQLRKLGELRDGGVLTAEEFDAKKAELLSRM